MTTINIARDFSRLPGPRYKDEGPDSGELFRETILEPAFKQAMETGEPVTVVLDGVTLGYPASFLEEAFGGLARLYSEERVRQFVKFVSVESPHRIDEIGHYLRDARIVAGRQ